MLRRAADTAVSVLRWIHRRLESAIALGLAVFAIKQVAVAPTARRVLWVLGQLVKGAIASALALDAVDGAATRWTVVAAIAKVALGWAPAVALAWSMRGQRLWVALGCLFTLPLLPFTLRACPTPSSWIALVLLSWAGVFFARRQSNRFLAALPMLELIVLPYLDHGWDLWWTGARLEARCARNDGQRPVNVTRDALAPAYFGVHVLPDASVLLTGETEDEGRLFGLIGGGNEHTGSWLLRRRGADLEIEGRAERPTGNLWNSCTLNGETWLPRAGMILGVSRAAGSPELGVRSIRIPMEGFDAAGIACDGRSGKVLVMEALFGYVWEVSPETGAMQRGAVSLGAGGLMKFRPSDGRLVLMQPDVILVYSLEDHRIEHRIPAGIAQMGFDVCPRDGAVVSADFTGRVRVFAQDPAAGYRFDWGLGLFAPRRVAFSPDCARIAVTSGNDRDVWIVDRASRKVVATYSVGPSVRGIAFLSDDVLAVADACTVTSLRVP